MIEGHQLDLLSRFSCGGTGVVFSIDDFGAGFTSLSYLISLTIGELKLDCKLITELAAEHRSRDRELVRSTIELGHAQGLRVVAEGVEDGTALDFLRAQHCDVAQGYFISRPLPADRIDFRPNTRASIIALASELDQSLAGSTA